MDSVSHQMCLLKFQVSFVFWPLRFCATDNGQGRGHRMDGRTTSEDG